MMRCERLSIPTSAGAEIALDVYVPAVSKEIDLAVRRPAIVICPAAATSFSEREAEPIALRFLPEGFNCFVVWYRVAPNRSPLPQQDVAAAVAWVRAHAETHTDPDRIAVGSEFPPADTRRAVWACCGSGRSCGRKWVCPPRTCGPTPWFSAILWSAAAPSPTAAPL